MVKSNGSQPRVIEAQGVRQKLHGYANFSIGGTPITIIHSIGIRKKFQGTQIKKVENHWFRKIVTCSAVESSGLRLKLAQSTSIRHLWLRKTVTCSAVESSGLRLACNVEMTLSPTNLQTWNYKKNSVYTGATKKF